MAKCDYCSTTILFGGKRHGDLRFCNDQCQQKGHLAVLSQQVPQDLVDEELRKVHQGNCPRCQGRGPVDLYISYRVWSALVLTSWSCRPAICCRSCGRKSQFGNMLMSLCFGWWGFPWGLVMTPVQVTRNLAAAFGGPDPSRPSPLLSKFVRIGIASRIIQKDK